MCRRLFGRVEDLNAVAVVDQHFVETGESLTPLVADKRHMGSTQIWSVRKPSTSTNSRAV